MRHALPNTVRVCWWIAVVSAALLVTVLLILVLRPVHARAEGSAQADPNQACLECHAGAGKTLTFPSGEALSMDVDVTAYGNSVHGARLDCLDCHERNREYPHPPVEVRDRRDYARAEYETCYRCHFEQYTRSLDSTHFDAMATGNAAAAICTDCHTAHAVTSLTGQRKQIAGICANCHRDIYDAYAQSVHGAALLEDNPDVPSCIDCHGVHDISSATTAAFRSNSVKLCSSCHSNKSLMSKYGISSDVSKTYLDDFHGKTVGFYQDQSPSVWPDVAVCTDCHGVHDIKRPDDPGSSVVKANLVATCRRCHGDATTNFPSAWLGHYEPSIDKAPIVFFVKQYYRILIPLMVAGLGLNVALDLWRLARNR
jgi:predicted CXXCH cytochrome family protein